MSKHSKDANASNDQAKKLDVKSETVSQVSDAESEQVVGGLSINPIYPINPLPLYPRLPISPIDPRAGKTTLNPTSSDGCCGGD